MTDPNYTHAVMVVDRSGSMMNMKNDAEGGVRAFIEEQQAIDSKMTFTLIQFDSVIETVIDFQDIQKVNGYTLNPRGGTALYDAIAYAINATGKNLRALPEEERPGNVLITIVTDGQENSSIEQNSSSIKKLIEEQENKYSWVFSFIGAGIHADQGKEIGIEHTVAYAGAPSAGYGAVSHSLAVSRSAVGVPLAASYSVPETVE